MPIRSGTKWTRTAARFSSTASWVRRCTTLQLRLYPHTIAGDGDPVDVLVVTQFALPPGVVVRCRPVGMLAMTDEAGADAKVLAVPVDKLTTMYRSVESPRDLPQITLDQIAHFFGTTKTSEPGKFVKIEGLVRPEEAKKEIIEGVERYEQARKTCLLKAGTPLTRALRLPLSFFRL